ncbi:glycosyltransferase [Nodosilinea sp. LEGE 06152]|uniref:glycosyltransferase n=1 Tax=Nodosilinea sp. LEGE 06152 TaxID=2777966 RepID=UPI00187F82D1|nr:glycosyltransferase [Nodosilinea sp. LEGE 06152]MBE9158369.1 glycosyltransferase [Nodosilinea sp. LEGE 06152]
MTNSRKTIAVWQPYFLGGGAEAVALWVLVALVNDYDVTLCTLTGVDLDHLNAMYGTDLSRDRLQVRPLLSPGLTRLVHGLIANLPWVRLAFIHWSIRRFKAISAQYDLAISTYNAVDLGQRGLQYIHWVNVVEQPWAKAGPIMKLMLKLSRFSEANLKANRSLTNSFCTAGVVKQTYGIDAQVVYPPVTTAIALVPWPDKETAFLCSGRVVVAKQTHRVIEILAAVRQRGFDVKLHITGGGGGTYGWGYERRVQKLAAANADWVTFHRDLPYADYLKILARCRYGIHHKPEPFGISVAEMVNAGMIPFVYNRGGQIEIVNAANSDIIFSNAQDAVEKIVAVLESRDRQSALLEALVQQKSLFSTERFTQEIAAAVATCLSPIPTPTHSL